MPSVIHFEKWIKKYNPSINEEILSKLLKCYLKFQEAFSRLEEKMLLISDDKYSIKYLYLYYNFCEIIDKSLIKSIKLEKYYSFHHLSYMNLIYRNTAN